MLVLRLEEDDGEGVFKSDVYSVSSFLRNKTYSPKYHMHKHWNEWTKEDYGRHPHDPQKMKTPTSDNCGYDKGLKREHFFGFQSWEVMNKNFRPYVRKFIKKNCRSKLSVYKINKTGTLIGSEQIAFIKSKAELIYRGPASLTRRELNARLKRINPKYEV